MNTSLDWKTRINDNPANWLLGEEDPSVAFWFLRDIVGRPEDAPALVELRERILYSPPVQALFISQDSDGFWEQPDSLDAPRYLSTLWSLVLLAEMGVSPTSRRARAASEFVLKNHLQADGTFTGLERPSSAGLLLRTLNYFSPSDARLKPAYSALATDAARGEIFALWALAEMPAEWRLPPLLEVIEQGADCVLNQIARGEFDAWGAFPPFESRDVLLALRVLTRLGKANDARAAPAIEEVWKRQGEGARWELERSFNGQLRAHLEDAGAPSRWATLNVLRIVASSQVYR